MRVLILGGSGMLGHKIWQILRERFDTWVTFRRDLLQYEKYGIFDSDRSISGVDAFNFDTVIRAVATTQPDIVINCIGIIKQLPSAKDPVSSLTVNSLFPHRLATLCEARSAQLIHISTDCVFSGLKGMYKEEDVSDAEDLYGRTKYLGEISAAGCLTLRTSIIGRELTRATGLVEWFLSNCGGEVQGYSNVIYSGLTTLAFANMLSKILIHHPQLSGLYHVSSQPISKFDLLCLINEAYGANVNIEPYGGIILDRSLHSQRFWVDSGGNQPNWTDMIHGMANDKTPYANWRI